jgi:hypothetical protein
MRSFTATLGLEIKLKEFLRVDLSVVGIYLKVVMGLGVTVVV